MPVLVQLENGQPRCVACGLCEFACPTDCISIVPGELEGALSEALAHEGPATVEILADPLLV